VSNNNCVIDNAGEGLFIAGIKVTSGGILSVFLNLLGTIILARAIGRGGMGKYDLLRQTAVLAVTFFSLGIGSACIFLLNKERISREEIATAVIRVLIFLGFILGIGISAAILIFPEYFGSISPIIAAYYGIGTGALLFVVSLRAFQVAQLASKRIVLADICAPLVVLFGLTLLWQVRRLKLEPALVLQASGNIATALVLLIWTLPYVNLRIRLRPLLIRRMLSLGAQLYATNLLQIMAPSLTLLVFRYMMLGDAGFESLGLFTRANALCGLGMLVPSATGPLLYAKWSGMKDADRKRHVELAGRMNIFYGGSVAVLLVLFGHAALRLLYGNEFGAAQVAVYALAPAVAVFSLSNVYLNLFASIGKAWLNAVIFACSTFFTVALTVLLVPRQGIGGAALATLFGQLFILASVASLGWRLQKVNFFHCLLPSWDDVQNILSRYRRRTRVKS